MYKGRLVCFYTYECDLGNGWEDQDIYNDPENIRQQALKHIFGNLKKSGSGNHKTKHSGNGDEHTGAFREYNFGDGLDRISLTESLKNAQNNCGIG
jgi:hypothetical protein